MTRPVRAILSVVVVFGALGALLFTTMRESAAYYKHVDEVMDTPETWYGKQMNLHGFVVEKSIMKRPDTLDYRFNVKNGDKIVLASYTGVVPDTFKDGAEVVLTGTLGPDGFHAKEVMAKCPSKYDPEAKAAKGGQ
ncbi:MAG: cytochrome c maturation protein CcmE [Acidobacteria bacterium]|nr:cytochrome c maturation protein CcmE [Acidobacteriota bacterium]